VPPEQAQQPMKAQQAQQAQQDWGIVPAEQAHSLCMKQVKTEGKKAGLETSSQ
jgi:hypothetical protein